MNPETIYSEYMKNPTDPYVKEFPTKCLRIIELLLEKTSYRQIREIISEEFPGGIDFSHIKSLRDFMLEKNFLGKKFKSQKIMSVDPGVENPEIVKSYIYDAKDNKETTIAINPTSECITGIDTDFLDTYNKLNRYDWMNICEVVDFFNLLLPDLDIFLQYAKTRAENYKKYTKKKEKTKKKYDRIIRICDRGKEAFEYYQESRFS